MFPLAFAVLLGCAPAKTPEAGTRGYWADAWPEADALLRRDPRWLGGDVAATIPLSEQRVLWLFGDSFVAQGRPAGRSTARMVRNSIAIQEGKNPACASLRFILPQRANGVPASFFPERDADWFWPAHGAFVDDALVIFLQRVRPDARAGGLGFQIAGWTAVRIANASHPPELWRLQWLETPDTGELGLVGAAVLVAADYVYAYAVREPSDHALALLRWRREAFARGELGAPEYWTGRGFGGSRPAIVVLDGASEFSVSRAPEGQGFLQVQSRGFGAVPIGLRSARALTGPWSAWTELYRPPELRRRELLIYAARAHPELAGAELVVTYASNSLDPEVLFTDESVYFPRFVRAGRGARKPPPPCERTSQK